MYVQCEAGFMEIDKWDGTPIPVVSHMEYLHTLPSFHRGDVLVVRSRTRGVLANLFDKHRIFHTPDWDYEFRVYASRIDVAVALTSTLDVLEYRNFKSHSDADAEDEAYVGATQQAKLAHDIWEVAYNRLKRDVRHGKASK